MLSALRLAVKAFMVPPGLLFILVGSGLLVGKKWPRVGAGLLIATALFTYALSTDPVAIGLMRLASRESVLTPEQVQSQGPQCQVIVVLGGGLEHYNIEYGGHSKLGYSSADRVLYGAYVHGLTGLPVAVTGGTFLEGEKTEGEAMGDLLDQMGVAEVWRETESTNTWENAQFTRALLPPEMKTILLVTDAEHAHRGRKCFEANGFEVIPAPTHSADEPLFYRGLIGLLPWSGNLDDAAGALLAIQADLIYEILYY